MDDHSISWHDYAHAVCAITSPILDTGFNEFLRYTSYMYEYSTLANGGTWRRQLGAETGISHRDFFDEPALTNSLFCLPNTVNSRISRNGAKANYGQPSQQEGTKNTKSPQFKHVESDHWAGSRKSSLAPFRLIREFTVSPANRFSHVPPLKAAADISPIKNLPGILLLGCNDKGSEYPSLGLPVD